MTIGKVAERTGVSAQAIRYYEREGLLPAPAPVEATGPSLRNTRKETPGPKAARVAPAQARIGLVRPFSVHLVRIGRGPRGIDSPLGRIRPFPLCGILALGFLFSVSL